MTTLELPIFPPFMEGACFTKQDDVDEKNRHVE